MSDPQRRVRVAAMSKPRTKMIAELDPQVRCRPYLCAMHVHVDAYLRTTAPKPIAPAGGCELRQVSSQPWLLLKLDM